MTEDFKTHKKISYNNICLFLVPIITIGFTFISFYGSNKFLVLHVIPLLLLLWCMTLVVSIIGDVINFLQKHTHIEVKKTVFYCFSVAFLLCCCFVELFSRSIILGGFHAS